MASDSSDRIDMPPDAAAEAPDDRGCLWPDGFRVVLAACLAASVLMTWPLWQARDQPPPLPVVATAQLNFGGPLLAACVLLGIAPRLGAVACCLGFTTAMLFDQTRIQPQIVSMLMLSLGTISWRPGVLAARASLVSLWLFAGLHKLLSPDYFEFFSPWLLGDRWNNAAGVTVAGGLALSEVSLGVGCLIPQTRGLVAAGAAVLHAAAFGLLSPLWLNWNSAVWPWNVALACAGPALIASWRGRALGSCWTAAPRWARGWAASLLLMPLGYHLGLVDAYLAACLYAANTPRGFICSPFERRPLNEFYGPLNVTLPPAHRLFREFFQRVGRPGTWLEVEDPRWLVGGSRKIRWKPLPSAEPSSPHQRNDQSHDSTR